MKTIGILGGGQLGRMSALAAANMGYTVHIFTPEENSPASKVSTKTIVADYTDEKALKEFASGVDVITYEFENIPVKTVRSLNSIKPVFPAEKLLEVSQDRIAEKSFLNSIQIETTRWKKLESPETVIEALKEWNTEAVIIKTTRFGYDGKGQIKYKKGQDINETLRQLNGELIIEEIVDFACEISVICARNSNGDCVTLGPMLNEHKDHILHKTTVPCGLSGDVCVQSIQMIKKLAQSINLIGIMTLELFVTRDNRLLANEIAPRTHNSGHWSMDACIYSQFDYHIRAITNMPLHQIEPHSDAQMLNLIGDDIKNTTQYLSMPNAYVHDYGKEDAREGRKMGHVNFITPRKK
jgi:5-(carboxyamino)imidazole ribonucleotide synthase